MPRQPEDLDAGRRADGSLARFTSRAQRFLDETVRVARGLGDVDALGPKVISALDSLLATTPGLPADALDNAPAQEQIRNIRNLLNSAVTAGEVFDLLRTGVELEGLTERLQGLYTRDARNGQQYSLSVMRLAASAIEMAYQSIVPPPLYQDGEPEDLFLRLTRHIEADPLQPSTSPQEHRPTESMTTTPPTIRHRGFPSPSQSPRGPSQKGSSRQTPGRSGQRTPATPLTQTFSAADVEGPPASNRRVLPPVPSSVAPRSPSSGGPPLPLPMAAPARPGDPSPTASASDSQDPGVKDVAHGLPHPGPCRYATAPIVVKHVNRCELCPTVTGKPGRPCVEEEVEVVVSTQLRPAPYPDHHPSVGSTLVYQLTLVILVEILIKFAKESFLLSTFGAT